MRNTTLLLIAAGIVLSALGLWLATVMPLREDRVDLAVGDIEATQTLHLNLWGFPVSKSITQRDFVKDRLVRERQRRGGTMGTNNHGLWLYQERINDGEWTTLMEWYIDGKLVTEDEWLAYRRKR